MNKKIWAAAAVGALVLFPACTDLTEVPQSAITPESRHRVRSYMPPPRRPLPAPASSSRKA